MLSNNIWSGLRSHHNTCVTQGRAGIENTHIYDKIKSYWMQHTFVF